MTDNIFEELEKINERPKSFEFYTASDLWTDEHTSKQMLAFHLNGDIDVSSRSTGFINRSVEWIVSRFSVDERTRIADFGCGPGLYATRFAQHGADVTGIDFSERSITYARKAADKDRLNIHYIHQDYLTFETADRFDLILMIMCDFCALSPVQRKEMLDKFRNILQPDGFVLLDAYTLAAFDKREETAMYEENLLNGFWSPNKYYGFLNTFKYEEEKIVLDKYTIFETDRIRTVYNWLQYFEPKDLEREFASSGFRIEGYYSDVAGSPYDPKSNELAVVAKGS
jgi:SAM-dependent methyltransferase